MKKFLCVISIIFVSVFSSGQYKHGLYGVEASGGLLVNIGSTYYFGDIETSSFFGQGSTNNMQFYGQLGYRHTLGISPFRLRYSVLGGRLSGLRKNYAFKSWIVEPSIVAEFRPLYNINPELGLYIYTGGACTYSKIVFENLTEHSVRNLNTFTPVLPIGGGYLFDLGNGLQLGLELSYRFALIENVETNLDGFPFTDRGKQISQWVDGYYTCGVIFSYQF
ncbi:MAG: hypothetical protein LBS16_01585 [Prevotellaceae bacterium]|jgi:hypothetical protein|nr:hypothetical protein [Prevotellaceae bacterium]